MTPDPSAVSALLTVGSPLVPRLYAGTRSVPTDSAYGLLDTPQTEGQGAKDGGAS